MWEQEREPSDPRALYDHRGAIRWKGLVAARVSLSNASTGLSAREQAIPIRSPALVAARVEPSSFQQRSLAPRVSLSKAFSSFGLGATRSFQDLGGSPRARASLSKRLERLGRGASRPLQRLDQLSRAASQRVDARTSKPSPRALCAIEPARRSWRPIPRAGSLSDTLLACSPRPESFGDLSKPSGRRTWFRWELFGGREPQSSPGAEATLYGCDLGGDRG